MKNNIVFSDSKKVVDIKSLNSEELIELREKIKESISKTLKKLNAHEPIASAILTIAIASTINTVLFVTTGHSLLATSGSNGINYDGLTIAATLEGMGVTLPILFKIISRNRLKSKYQNDKDTLEEIDMEYDIKRKEKKITDDRSKVYNNIIEIQSMLSENYDLDDNQEWKRKLFIKDLLEKGANKKIIKMPIVQKLLDITISKSYSPVYSVGYKYSNSTREDGTFDIEANVKIPYGAGPIHDLDLQSFKITYSDDNNENFIKATTKDDYIINIDKKGNITTIEKELENGEIISVPFGEELSNYITK